MAALTVQSGSHALGSAGVAVEWAMAGAAAQGQAQSGDRHLIAELGGGLLFGVVDAIGHGNVASTVADSAVRALREAGEEPLEVLVQRCHERLKGTRGAVLALAWFEGE